VQVDVTRYAAVGNMDRGSSGSVEKQGDIGSGFIVDPDGYILTNAHVVKNALRIRVLLTARSDGHPVNDDPQGSARQPEQDAHIVGMDSPIDLALLKIDVTGLPTLPFADYTKLRQGQIVLAFGNPEGFDNSVTMGVVSSVGRQVLPNAPAIYIQTDAPINHGNSGGPLVNVAGEVIGVNTFMLSESGGSQGLGFAIPSSLVQFVYHELRTYGQVRRGEIGMEPLPPHIDLFHPLPSRAPEGRLGHPLPQRLPAYDQSFLG
jgi:serine protease Do